MNDELITGVQSPASGQIRIKASELRHPGTFGVPSTYAEEGTFPLGARTGNDQPTTFAIVDYAANEPGRHLSQNTPSAKPPPLKRHHLEPLRGRSANVHLAQLATALATQPESPASISTVSAASPASSLMNNTSLQERSDESQLEGLSDFGQINRFSEIDQEFHMPATWRASASSTMTDESWHWSERSTAAFLGFATGILVIVPTVMLLSTEPSWIKFSSLLSSGNSSIPQLLDEHKGAEETSPNLPDHAAIRVRSASHPSTEQPALKPQHAGEIATASAMPSGIWYDSTEPAEKSASPDLTSRQLPTAESPALQPALASDQTGVPASSTAQPSAAAVPITESETLARAALAAGDIAEARQILRSAASASSPQLWLLLAETYDPAPHRSKPDQQANNSSEATATDIEFARYYYQQALAHGIRAASVKLEALKNQTTH